MFSAPFYRCCFIAFTAWFSFQPCTAFAQTVDISGTVLSNGGLPIATAHISLNKSGHFDVSNANGRFSIQNIKPGRYLLTVNRLGYQSFSKILKISHEGFQNLTIRLQSKKFLLDEFVVTATRTRKALEDVPLPVTVIQKDHIEHTGSMRLGDILGEATGLRLNTARGQTGLQVQGFSSEYTLIMINGQPLVGRRSGTLDLNRISVGNIKRIEIIKGPSSALWGSSALAGVVNLITETSAQPFSMDVTSRYGTHQTFDLGATLSWQTKDWQNTFYANQIRSAGYSLVPNTISQTVPKFQNYTVSYRTDVSVSDRIDFNFYGRFYQGDKDINSFIGDAQSPELLDVDETTRNFGFTPSLGFDVTQKLRLDITHFISGYKNSRNLIYKEGGKNYQSSVFDQSYYKTDFKATQSWNNTNASILGFGMNRENLNSNRYADLTTLRNLFVYSQHDWDISSKLSVIAGFRFDHHNVYGSQISPKFSIQYKVTDWLHLRASTGKGFKAPNFSQLFLSYSNPTVGYSAFGTAIVKEGVEELQKAGKISKMLRDLDALKPIEAEHSWAFNTGFDLIFASTAWLKVNIFQNKVDNLIDVAPIAAKNNGQLVYTYFNLNKAYTRGLETNLTWWVLDNLELSIGYQYLLAKQFIERTKTVQDPNGNPIEKTFRSYKPMFNRSKHSGTFKLFYKFKPLGLSANFRGTYLGPYGFIDSNGNGYVDSGEYSDGYMIWDTAVSKTFKNQYSIQLGIDNVFNFTRPGNLSHIAGRLFYVQISLNL